jgi:hypothetical protein
MPMPFFDSNWLKNWHTSAILIQKVIPFAVMKPYQLPSDQKISSTWVYEVVLQCDIGSC